MQISLGSPQNISQSKVITNLEGVDSLTATGASINFEDLSQINVNCSIKETGTKLCKLLFNNQSRLAEIIDSTDSLSNKLNLIVKEAVDANDYE